MKFVGSQLAYLITPLTIETMLAAGSDLLMLGSLEQRKTFAEVFEQHRGH